MINSAVHENQNNKRLDQVLAEVFSDYSRSKLQDWLSQGLISLNGTKYCKGKIKVKTGDVIQVDQAALDMIAAANTSKPENIDLNIVYQDQDIIIINKPANLVVHPGAGNKAGTLMNGLLYHFPELKNLPRAGVVHRLDKDTTGLMVVARNLAAHNPLVKQLEKRTITRKYVALINGHMICGGKVDLPIGRHKTIRTKMAIFDHDDQRAKPAITHYTVAKKYPKHSLLSLKLETGRTHQIRLHMAHLGYPIVGDALYGRCYVPPKDCSAEDIDTWQAFKRQALAAVELGFQHPATKEQVSWSIPVPDDMLALINILDNLCPNNS